MHARRFIGSMIATAALLVPVAAQARPEPVKVKADVRFYDANHKDYHNWDDHEDVMYRGYLTDHHMKYRAFAKQSRAQQQAYWEWRHSHE